jgi:hypothetical protein
MSRDKQVKTLKEHENIMKTLILLSFILMCALQSIAQRPGIRRPTPTPPPIPIQKDTPEQAQAKVDAEMVKRRGFFARNTSFTKDTRYYSEDGRYFFAFQSDGNLVVYKGSKAIWNSHTNGKAVAKCVFQGDGNLVMYDYANKVVWDSNTDSRNRRAVIDKLSGIDHTKYYSTPWMTMQNDGNLVIYGLGYPTPDFVQWSSNSFEKN